MLAVASEDKCLECVKLLLKAGADRSKRDFFGDTVAHIAGMNKNNKILDYLVKEAGIDLNQPNHRGETPLQRCQTYNNQEGVEILSSIAAEAFDKANQSLLDDLEADERKKAKNAKKRQRKKAKAQSIREM